jgi:transaldolase
VIFLDSASSKEVEMACKLGVVSGVTTNPTLMARESSNALGQLEQLLKVSAEVSVFYQPVDAEPVLAEREARTAHGLDDDRVVVKLPARLAQFGIAARLVTDEIPCAITAVYSPGQALIAAEVGATWIIPYVDRARRLLGENLELVRRLRAAADSANPSIRILAASIKSPEQAIEAMRDGAHGVTVPIEIIEALAHHDLTESAIEEFSAAFPV